VTIRDEPRAVELLRRGRRLGLSFLDVLAYEWQTVAALAALLVVVTHLVIR